MSTSNCYQCGSTLIETEKTTRGNKTDFNFMTITSYRCSNIECQGRIDKVLEEMMQKKLALTQKIQSRSKKISK